MNKTLLVYTMLIIILTVYLTGCEFNIYLPDVDDPDHEHDTNNIYQDGEFGHHWECSICGHATNIEPHSYENNLCSVCGYEKASGDVPTSGGFEVNIVIKEPFGVIQYEYDEENNIWHFSIKDNSNVNFPIRKWTWYLFGEEQSTSQTFDLVTPYEISYEISCEYENNYGFGDSTVVITGRTK